jgi:hypothetical protein
VDGKLNVLNVRASVLGDRCGERTGPSLSNNSYSKVVDLHRHHLEYLSLEDREQILYKAVQEVWSFRL